MTVDASSTVLTPLDDLREDPRNPKDHDLPGIMASLRRLGWIEPVVVDQRTGLLVSGHGRTEALRVMRAAGESPPAGVSDGWGVPTFAGWASVDDDEVAAALVTLNRLTETGGWHEDQLADLLGKLADVDGGMVGVGYDRSDLDDLRARLAELDSKSDPWGDRSFQPMPDSGDVASGQVWKVGAHLLACDDSRDPAVWARLLGGLRGDMLFTDPPYGIDYSGGGVERERLQGDGADEAEPLLRDVLAAVVPVLRPGASTYVCLPDEAFLRLASVLHGHGMYRWMLVWVKDRATFGRSDYHPQHEVIVYGWVPGAAHHALADRKQTTVWQVDRPANSDRHPTAKPPELAQRAIRNSTDPGQIVIDPFAGSGSTLVAAHREGRVGVGCEFEPGYVAQAIRWLSEETGEPAVLVHDGAAAPTLPG